MKDFIVMIEEIYSFIENNNNYRPADRSLYDASQGENLYNASITFKNYKKEITPKTVKLPENSPEAPEVETVELDESLLQGRES